MNRLYGIILRLLLPVLAAVCPFVPEARAQRPSFADGYHGGIYGHYPMWCTRFFAEGLAETPEWRINLEIEPETWDSVRLRTPADYEAFRTAAVSPRVEFVNPAYGQPYCFNIHGEPLVRHFEYGIAKLREHFPDAELKCYSSEEPCFTDCLPAVLRGFGFRYAVLKCPDTCWGGYLRGHGRGVVSWVGPSGDSIPALPRYECEAFVDGSTWQTAAWNNSDAYLDACRRAGVRFPAGMCFQDAGWRNGPWYWPCSASPCQGGGEARQSPHSSGCPAAGQGRGSPQARQRPPTYGPRARAQAGQRPWASIPASGPEPLAPSSSTGVPQTGQRCSLKPSRRVRRNRKEERRNGASGTAPGLPSLT